MTFMSALPDSANSSEDYCTAKGIPDGSNLYYACLFENQKNKDRIICLHALNNELSDVLVECSDPGLARIKYQWWQEELDRLAQHQARHPLTKQIQQLNAANDKLITDLKTAVTGYEKFIQLGQPASLQTCLTLFMSSAGYIWKQSIAEVDGISEDLLQAVTTMAAFYQLLASLQQPNIYLTEACCIVPANYCEVQDLTNPASFRQIEKGFTSLIEDVVQGLDDGYLEWKHQMKYKYRVALILNRLARATATEILDENSQLMNKRVSLTPFRKLCIAWWTNLRLG